MTGVPQANDSATGSPKPSLIDGKTVNRATRSPPNSRSSSAAESASTGRPAAWSPASVVVNDSLFQEFPPMKARQNRWPSRHRQLGCVQYGEMVLPRLVAADHHHQRKAAHLEARPCCSRWRPRSTGWAWAGSTTGWIRGPGRPVPASMSRQPRYSPAAPTEIGAMLRA